MITRKNLNLKQVIIFSGHHIIWLSLWASFVVSIYKHAGASWLTIPWLPVSIIGTAVAFYLGFKNNQAYNRMWEARKIWGAIVNSSRAWGSYVTSFIGNTFRDENLSEKDLHHIHKQLIYRHVAWLYTLRQQLLVITPWEHANQKSMVGVYARMYRKRFGLGLVSDQYTESEVRNLLFGDEYDQLSNSKNMATQLIQKQSLDLKELRDKNLIDDFRHMELEKLLYDFYVHQGKCERIKKFPLPRQFGGMSVALIAIFIFLLPFSLVTVFTDMGEWGAWWSVPFTVMVGWVYIVMELVGDYSENPFQGMANDIPMLSLCRTIEIDLRQMLKEEDLPPAIEAKNNILM